MNLSIRGHLLTRKVAAIKFEEPNHFMVIFEDVTPFGLEYIEFDMSELTGASSIEKCCDELSEKFK